MSIQILPDELASKIAAGEVIERPASVVKELIENAIDAHAKEIKLEVRGGGQRLIRVMDDGDGIPADEVPLAFARHATSKLKSVDDLFRLQTLGFRGEALPSIAAVARVTLVTRARGEDVGSFIRLDGGRTVEQHPHGAPAGTIITVEDLFEHVPARLKFMKAATTEAAQISELVGAYAMAYPQLRFSLVHDGRLAFQSAGSGKLREVLVKIFGADVAKQMLEVGDAPLPAGDKAQANDESNVTRVSGFVSPPAVHRSTRKYLFLFVNGRWIEDRSLAHAVTEAYHTWLMVGRYPIAVLNLDVPPEEVDVNVHPTKSQVRFRAANTIYQSVQRAVRHALVQFAPATHTFTPSPSNPAPTPDAAQIPRTLDLIPPRESLAPLARREANPPTETEIVIPSPADARFPMLRVLGQIASTYILAEGPDGMYIVDQHAAHERVLYEKMNGDATRATVPAQVLLEPALLELTPSQFAMYQKESVRLNAYGFSLEEFGGTTVLLRALPGIFKTNDARRALTEVLDEMNEGNAPLEQASDARLITAICKGAAIKGGQTLSLDEMRELIRQLEQTASPRTCPHGRPTVIRFDLSLLEREFGRRG